MESLTLFSKFECRLNEGGVSAYYVYPKNQKKFDRVLVYIHGLLSDIHWFEIPENLPKGTGVLFIPREPRTDVDSFETWTRHYEQCFLDFKKSHESNYYHLLGHCFGALCSLHWATVKPENFTTLTIVSPPFHLRKNFGLRSIFEIVFGAKNEKKRCLLTSRSFARLPKVTRFIEENPTTTFKFSNGFYLETARLRRWIQKNVFAYPVPAHAIYSSEDGVIKMDPHKFNGHVRDFPDETSIIYSDHYAELLPGKAEFWKSVFDFQLKHEIKYEMDGKIKKILITGATGFVGSHIARLLATKGKEVVCLVRSPQKGQEMFAGSAGKIEFREGNLDNLDSLQQALKGIDAVIHTAAHVSDWDKREKFETVNVEGTKNLLMIAHAEGIKQFIHISSLGIFGDTDQENLDENSPPVYSTDYYSDSKIHAETFVKKYCRANKIPYTIIRPGFIYGEGDNNFFPRLIKNLELKKFKYVGSKNNILNAVYVGNIAELTDAVLGNQKSFGETFNLANAEKTTIGEFIPRVASELGLPQPEKIIPVKIAVAAAIVGEALYRLLGLKEPPPVTRKKVTFAGRSRSINPGKAYKFLGRVPYSYEESLKRTLEAFKK